MNLIFTNSPNRLVQTTENAERYHQTGQHVRFASLPIHSKQTNGTPQSPRLFEYQYLHTYNAAEMGPISAPVSDTSPPPTESDPRSGSNTPLPMRYAPTSNNFTSLSVSTPGSPFSSSQSFWKNSQHFLLNASQQNGHVSVNTSTSSIASSWGSITRPDSTQDPDVGPPPAGNDRFYDVPLFYNPGYNVYPSSAATGQHNSNSTGERDTSHPPVSLESSADSTGGSTTLNTSQRITGPPPPDDVVHPLAPEDDSDDILDLIAASAVAPLENKPGANNCWLNAVIQCLVRLKAFYEPILAEKDEHVGTDRENCVLCALQDLIRQYQNNVGDKVISVSKFRDVLGSLDASLGKGTQADAGESFTNIMNMLHDALVGKPQKQKSAHSSLQNFTYVTLPVRSPSVPPPSSTASSSSTARSTAETPSSSHNNAESEEGYSCEHEFRCAVHRAFLLRIRYTDTCSKCRSTIISTPSSMKLFIRPVEFVASKSLLSMFYPFTQQALSNALKCGGDELVCSKGCIKSFTRTATEIVGELPPIITLEFGQYAGDSDVARVLNLLSPFNISNVFTGAPSKEYRLKGFVAYRSGHYVSFQLATSQNPKSGKIELTWTLFDDSKSTAFSDWNVCKEHVKHHQYQPTLVFFVQAP